MLRWRLPHIRVVGGQICASYNIRTACFMRLTPQRTPEGRSLSLYNTVARVLTHCRGKADQHAGRVTDVLSSEDRASSPDVTPPSCTTSTPQHLPISLEERRMTISYPEPGTSFSSSAILALKALLSPDNLTRPKPTVYTANTIRSIYRSAKARNLVHHLTASEFSALIGLFGTLSLSSGAPYESIFAHPLAARIPSQAKPGRSYWPLVTEIIREKDRQLRKLSRSDRFFGMHARLSEFDGRIRTEHLNAKAKRSLRSAGTHYETICSTSFHPDVHLPYLEALLQHPECVEEAIDTFCNVVVRLSYINVKLLDFLWRLVTVSSRHASQHRKTKLLASLSSRAQNALANAARLPSPDTPDASSDTRLMTIEDLTQSISHAFTCNTSLPSVVSNPHSHLLRWSLEATITELSPDHLVGSAIDTAWAQLCFIASSQRCSLTEMEDLCLHEDPGGSWSWKALCILSQIENAANQKTRTGVYDHSGATELVTIRRILESLWYKWSAMRLRESRIYLSIESTIIATFLRVARRIGDIEFVENSWSFLQTSGSFAAREVAAEYCAATIAHGHDIRQIFLTILAHVHPPSRSVVVQDVLARLLVVDIEMGARVFAWAQQSHLTIDSNIIRELAMQIAARGNTVDALRYVDDPGLRVEHKLDVLASLLQCVVDPSRTLLSPRSFERSVSGLVRTQRPPSQPPRGLEESLLAALMVRRLSWLPRLIGAIQKFWPSFFSERFLILTAEEFVQQRQSWAALRLLHRSGLINADTQRTLMLKLVRTGAYKAAASMLKYPWPREGQLSISAHLLQLLRSSRKKPSRLLKVLGPWVAARTSAEVRLVSKVLAGYARSSQLFCTGTNDGVIQRNRIAIGNTIIYASVTRGKKRQARRVRHALAVFSKLREEQGFVPDRVTVNILLKAILHWTKAVDSQAVRALFDRMVRSGYPVSDSFSPGVGPFGMHSTSDIQFQVPELTSPILYAIHVRPLYKMFIKALYLRGDDQGARTIVGILKGLEARDRLARVQRIVMPMRNGRRG